MNPWWEWGWRIGLALYAGLWFGGASYPIVRWWQVTRTKCWPEYRAVYRKFLLRSLVPFPGMLWAMCTFRSDMLAYNELVSSRVSEEIELHRRVRVISEAYPE